MTNHMEVTSYRSRMEENLHLDTSEEVEVHDIRGHVVYGVIKKVVWDHSVNIEALVIVVETPSGPTYERIVRWDHVVEVRPTL